VKRLFAIFICLWLTSSAGAEECRTLSVVEWILGEWTTTPDRVVIRENWHRVSDKTFEVVNYETLRLVAMSDGVFYIAKVTHNELPVPFRLTQCSEGVAIFENLAHDAPQRLIYTVLEGSAPGDAELEVRVEGDGMNDFSLLFHRL
jgi:hypothetical protein